MDSSAPPDAVCSDTQLLAVLRDLGRSFSQGLTSTDVQGIEAVLPRLGRGDFWSFEFRDVVFQGHAAPSVSLHLHRRMDGRIELSVFAPGDLLLGQHVKGAVKALAPEDSPR